MATATSSVTASFSTGAGAGTALKIEEDTGEGATAPYGSALVRVWDIKGTPKVVSTSGRTCQLLNSAVSLKVTETITINNTTGGALRSPIVSQVSYTPVGSFLDSLGSPISPPSFSIDEETGAVTTSIRCFGAVSVTYTTTFARYLCPFARDPYATKGDSKANPPIPPSHSAFAPMIAIAVHGSESDSVPLSPPARAGDDLVGIDGGTGYSGDSTPNSSGKGSPIVFEQDSSMLWGDSAVYSDGLYCRARFYVYFGALSSQIPVCSSGTVDTDYNGFYESIEIRDEMLSWANQASVTLKYLPTGPANVSASSNKFTTRFDGDILPTFVSTKDTEIAPKIHVAGQLGVYKYGPPVRTQHGEVVVTMFGGAVECTGSALATYNTRRVPYVIWWKRLPSGWFPPVTVSVAIGVYSGSLVINPPSNKGNK